jgi:hypothetical protein
MRKTPYRENIYWKTPTLFYAASFTFLASRLFFLLHVYSWWGLTVRGGGDGAISCEGDLIGVLFTCYVFVREILAAPTNDLANFLKQRSLFYPLLCGSGLRSSHSVGATRNGDSATAASQNSACMLYTCSIVKDASNDFLGLFC